MTCRVTVDFQWPDWTLYKISGAFIRQGAGEEPFDYNVSIQAPQFFRFSSRDKEIYRAIDFRYFMRRDVDGIENQGGTTTPLQQVPDQDFRFEIKPK